MIAALLLAATPVTAQDCGDLPQQPMNLCFLREFEGVDAEMNAQWKLTAAASKAADRELQPDDRQPRHFPTLLAAQRAWLTYRDRHCLGASFEARGGSLAPTLDSLCRIELTRDRTRQLKAMVGDDR